MYVLYINNHQLLLIKHVTGLPCLAINPADFFYLQHTILIKIKNLFHITLKVFITLQVSYDFVLILLLLLL